MKKGPKLREIFTLLLPLYMDPIFYFSFPSKWPTCEILFCDFIVFLLYGVVKKRIKPQTFIFFLVCLGEIFILKLPLVLYENFMRTEKLMLIRTFSIGTVKL